MHSSTSSSDPRDADPGHIEPPAGAGTCRRPLVTLLITVLVAAATFWAVETVARRVMPPVMLGGAADGLFRLDAKVGWRFLSDHEYPAIKWFGKELPMRYTTNSRGLKGTRPYPAPRQPGEFRVMCLGDSTANMVYFDGYPEMLERMLAAALPDRSVWVLNAGVNGYSSLNTRFLAREELPNFNPDVVIVTVGTDDAMLTNRPDRVDYEVGNFNQAIARLAQHSRLVTEIRDALPWLITPLVNRPGTAVPANLLTQMVPRTSPEELRANMEAIVRMSQRAGAFPILTLQPWLFWDLNLHKPGGVHRPLTPWTAQIHGAAGATGAGLVDAIALFDRPDRAAFFMVHEAPDNQPFGMVSDPVHLNEPGNELLAAEYALMILDHVAAKNPGERIDRSGVLAVREKYRDQIPEANEAHVNGVPSREYYEHLTDRQKELNATWNPRPWLEAE